MFQSFLRTFSGALLVAAGCFCLLTVFLLISVTRDLPDVRTLKDYQPNRASEVFSDDGKKIGEFTSERRYPVDFDSVPILVRDAFIAAEDAGFYSHHGIDFSGIIRAVRSNLLRGRFAQGASTITQQVARGILLASRKKELTRKLREMLLAWRMEKALTKNEILSLYLNDIYLGHGAYGIGAASQNYFRKKVTELTLAEGALLAGLPQRPNDWDPFHNPYYAKMRQQYVLRRMLDEQKITATQMKAAIEEPIRLYTFEDINLSSTPYFTEHIRQYVMGKYSTDRVLNEGLRIETTVNYETQKLAEEIVDHGLRAVDKRLGWRGVREHLEDAQKISAFQATVHDLILEELTKARILLPNVDSKTRKLAFDLSPLEKSRSIHFGQTPITEGEYYLGVITGLDSASGQAIGKIGLTSFVIPSTEFEWITLRSPGLKHVNQILQIGDVVQVRVVKLDKVTLTAQVSLEQEPEVQGALLSYELDTGYVKTMFGGTDFKKSKFNIALQAKRQVGSTFKAIIYASAFDRGYSPSSLVTDSPIVFKYEGTLDADNTGEHWRPNNYTGKFEGEIPLRLALIRSMNIPTVKLVNELTVDYLIEYTRKLGITSPLQRDLSIALGSWSSSLEELTRAFAVFPRLGKPISLVFVKRVLDAEGNVLEDNTNPSGTHAEVGELISPQTAYVTTDMLRGAVREGTGTAAAIVPGAAGKTGTSNDHRDAWFIGYTPKLMTGVWLGFERDKALSPGETGGKAAAPIWADFMVHAVKNYPQVDYPIPDDITFAYVDKDTGRLATASTQRRVRVAFKVGMVPNTSSSNIPRIGEPSLRMTSTTENTGEPTKPPKADDTDYLRQGYQD